MNYRDEIIEQLGLLPPIPHVAMKLSVQLSDPKVDVNRLVDTVKYDPGLTARLIVMANSAYMGGSGSITSLKEALVRLGNKQVYGFVVSTAVQPMMNSPLEGYGLQDGDMWRKSVVSAVAAESLEVKLGGSQRETAFTAAILHDIGKLALNSFVRQESVPLTQSAHFGKNPFEQQEAELLGMSHNEAGARLLRMWKLPEELVSVALWHHDPNLAERDQHLVDIVHLADSVCMSLGLGLGDDGLCYRLSSESFTRLGATEKLLQEVAVETLSDMDSIIAMFNLKADEDENV
jgi:putative nucleotidyltransferase with HDIG domain